VEQGASRDVGAIASSPSQPKHTYLAVAIYPPATEETGAMGREIESRQGYGRVAL
jgi:hypothetical protein